MRKSLNRWWGRINRETVGRWFQRVVIMKVHQSWLLVMLCIGIVIGVVLGIWLRVNYFVSGWWIGLVVIISIIGYMKPKLGLAILMVMAGMVLAFWRISTELCGQDYINGLLDKTIVVTGVVSKDPETEEGTTKYKLGELRFGEEEIKSVGSLYISSSEMGELEWGDTVVLSGKMSAGFGTYAGFMYRPKVLKWEKPEPGSWILEVRNWFAERIERLLPEREAKLGLSYLLGMKTGLEDEFVENLRMVGLTHIVVASGAHLSILVGVARKVFGRLSRFAGLLFAGLLVVCFMAMIGWTPSIMRAGIMTILSLTGWYVGRKVAPWRLILIVAAATLIISPMFIMDLGWLLSFASFGGIMMLGPKMTECFYGGRKPGVVAETIMMTVAATLMTLPIVLYYYGAVSLIAVVANLLILPTLPWAMGVTFAVGVVVDVPMVAEVMAWCAEKILSFHIGVVEWLGQCSQFLVEIEPYQMWVWVIYGVILIWPLVGLIKQKVVKLWKEDNKILE